MVRCFSLLLVCALALSAADRAELIVSARYVVTVNRNFDILPDGAVAVRDGAIVAVGSRADVARQFVAARTVALPDAILMPGLINTHTHAAMSLLRGIADDVALEDWLENYIFPAEAKNVTPEFVEWGTKLACLEMMLSGTTTLTDMYYFEDVAARAVKQAGMRGVMGETVIRFPVADAKTPADALAYSQRFLQQFAHDQLIVPAVAPHALFTNSDETLQAVRALADRYRAPVLIHVLETKKERDDIQSARHMSTVQVLDRIGLLNGRTVAAHCVWASPDDIAILARHHTGVAHCPSSNMKLASGAAPVLKMLASGIDVGLGTDGPAGSNNALDLMQEMDLAGKLQKLQTLDPKALPARKIIEMATIDGARTLGLDPKIGSLEAGKRADMIAISLNEPEGMPVYGVASEIVYALHGADVRDVWVNGREIVADRQPTTLNPVEVYAHARALSEKVKRCCAARVVQ